MKRLLEPADGGERYELHCPRSMPNASTFLWNSRLLLQLNCRGYAVAQYLQPEPTKYSHAPILEHKTFMQPEQPFYAHHPGRFVYVMDRDSGEMFSAPHEPARKTPESFTFSAGKGDVGWSVLSSRIKVDMTVSLPLDDVAELWTIRVSNESDKSRRLKLFPYFTIGYMSWMNQSAEYSRELGGIVARSVTPYQKLEDYAHVKTLKDMTVLLHSDAPDGWEACRDAFEGEGGIQRPDSVLNGGLQNGDAIYETPVAVLEYAVDLQPGESREFRFVFAPVRTTDEALALREAYLAPGQFEESSRAYAEFLHEGAACLSIETPDPGFDNFVNHWLGRQVYYHGVANRLTTDPQTRNFLQDAMGMVYVDPGATRAAICRALRQQRTDGAMPEGIVLNGGELKYINQIPHTDHCVWLPIVIEAYLDETGDFTLLDEAIRGDTDEETLTILQRVTRAMHWLVSNRDERGLSLVDQGDWCDPMNMVGPNGKGISSWLSIATVHALQLWATICDQHDVQSIGEELRDAAEETSQAIQAHLWDGNWFARGISDNGQVFGVQSDNEGQIWLNPQSWAVIAGIATPEQQTSISAAVQEHLGTPYGSMLLAPAYTSMQEHIGRVTQKHPGSGENGAIYIHATTFRIYSMYLLGEFDAAFAELRRTIPGPEDADYRQRGQLPVFIPNYYRGAITQFPRTAGRSSQLFNTGAASWLYRIITEQLFGLRGVADGLRIDPALPSDWNIARVTRRFRGATLTVTIERCASASGNTIVLDGEPIVGNVLSGIEAGCHYDVHVSIKDTSA